jgi:C-terminal processing protease CtpA/Prc
MWLLRSSFGLGMKNCSHAKYVLKLSLLTVIWVVIFYSCNREPPNSFKRSFYQSFGIIQDHFVRTKEIDWPAIEKRVFDSIPKLDNNIHLYDAIRYVLHQIEDEHSFFLPPDKKLNVLLQDSVVIPKINSKVLEGKIGYLKIPGFIANDSLSREYTVKIRNTLHELDQQGSLLGWIIDLRDNKGGRFGMIGLGLEPLFDKDTIAFSINNKNEFIAGRLVDGAYHYGNSIQLEIKNMVFPDSLKNTGKPLAVIVNGKTASLGEGIALSFQSHFNAKIFGSKTRGLTTDVEVFEFVSGARLGISTAFMCNAKKEIFPDGIIPDVLCEAENSIDMAIEWIKSKEHF